MAIFVIGDLHLSLGGDKPMDVFEGWEGYLPKLEKNWRKLIAPEDTVILAGDTSWAMHLADAETDFAFIQSLPGQKWMLKGNHDYWWSTASKMNKFLTEKGFDTLHVLHNNCVTVGDVALCGTRGWPFDDLKEQNAKIMAREVGRLKMSLDAADAPEKIVILHYPPVFPGGCAEELVDVMKGYGVKRCYYGHLHGKAMHYAVKGVRDKIEYHLVSADGLGFCPYKISE